MDLSLDINDLTIDDVVDLEEVTGSSIQNIMQTADGVPQGRFLKALVWITQRKIDPSFTFEQAGAVSFSALSEANVEASPPDPDEAAG